MIFNRRPTERSRRRRAGFTLVELMMALLGMAAVAVAITVLSSATARAKQNQKALWRLTMHEQVIMRRLGDRIRAAVRILDAGDSWIVLWSGDADDSGAPCFLEMERIEHDTAVHALSSHLADPLAPGVDTDLPLTGTDFGAVTAAATQDGTFVESRWGRSVDAFELTLNDPDPAQATLVTWRMSLQSMELEDTLVCAAALRDPLE